MKIGDESFDVIIIGAGFSGTMVAVHLTTGKNNLRIALVERGKAAGRGVAYGTTDSKHLLNVRADQMGAFPSNPSHFYQWLEANPKNLATVGLTKLDPNAFVPRMLFGDYIQDLLGQAKASDCLQIIYDEIIDITQQKDGRFQLVSRKGKTFEAGQVVLALGNFPPNKTNRENQTDCSWFSNNPYSPVTCAQLAQPGDVLVIGTGLTSLDVMLSLAPLKKEGKIHFLSRGGLFPQPHQRYEPYPAFFNRSNLPKTTRGLLHRVHNEIRKAAVSGFHWQAVVDSIRPFNQEIWKGLTQPEQKLFLRHLRSIWDTHRHRCAPEIMAQKEQLEAEGRVVCHRGHIQGYRPVGDQVEVTYRPRATQELRKFVVRSVLSCTGPQSDYRKLDDPLVRNLLQKNLLAPDPLRMGAHTHEGGQVCNGSDEPIRGLYTIGSPEKGRLYESIAVPELRVQAADLAERLKVRNVSY